ncbi:MAG: hypothetical protein IIC84_09625 [Chloroflexi bacterium]|nr:hypothetical protein [Chloroflexota bacterium]
MGATEILAGFIAGLRYEDLPWERNMLDIEDNPDVAASSGPRCGIR